MDSITELFKFSILSYVIFCHFIFLRSLILKNQHKLFATCYHDLCNIISCCLVTLSCPTLLQPHALQPTRLFCPWDFQGKNTGVGCHFLLQGTFPTQGSNLHLLHWQADSLSLSYQESPIFSVVMTFFVYDHVFVLSPYFQLISLGSIDLTRYFLV